MEIRRHLALRYGLRERRACGQSIRKKEAQPARVALNILLRRRMEEAMHRRNEAHRDQIIARYDATRKKKLCIA
jgi:hypothetical protein